MPFETPLVGFALAPPSSAAPNSIRLEQPSTTPGGAWKYELLALGPTMVRVKLGRGDSPGVIESGLKREAELPSLPLEQLEVDKETRSLSFQLSSPSTGVATAKLVWSATPQLTITDAAGRVLHRDLPEVGFVFEGTRAELALDETARGRQGGLSWYTSINLEDLCLGLGEKAAPLSLNRRRFSMDTTNAALYDAFRTDPLYKSLPFLLQVPSPLDPVRKRFAALNPTAGPPLVTGIFTPSAGAANWDLGCEHNDPLGHYKKYTQIEGPFDAVLSWGATGQDVKDGWRSILQSAGGAETLAARSWFGYLASTMGQAESDSPPAQHLLAEFPAKCKKEGIPVSALCLSSGYTVDKMYGYRMVFNWNRDRYPDFEGLMRQFHQDGIKVTANVKPYVSCRHPAYEHLQASGALFSHPETGEHATTQVWSGLWDVNAPGSWVDMSSEAGRKWWYDGCTELQSRGIDSMWNDDNEFALADGTFVAKWELPSTFTNPGPAGPKPVGLVGKTVFGELMGYTSQKALLDYQPERRPFIMTRSLNVGGLAYVNCSWSGDNWTSWENYRGNTIMGINAGISFIHTYGDDVGGFGGPLPSPELFLRWVQSSIYRSRFCIHSFKPTPEDPSGNALVNEPWMYPKILPDVRAAIERRYEVLPFLYALAWEGCTDGRASMNWLGWDQFERDPNCYTTEVLEGADYWIGCGKLLVAGCFYPGVTERKVYLPSCAASGQKDEVYFDTNTGTVHDAGQTVNIATPLSTLGLLARAGTVIPIGKPCVTITAATGLPATHADGTSIVLKDAGGVVEFDDFRGVEIFPAPIDKGAGSWEWAWNEDDGESKLQGLKVSRVHVAYSTSSAAPDEVAVVASWERHAFSTLWTELWVVLPKGDARAVQGGRRAEWRGRQGWFVPIGERQ